MMPMTPGVPGANLPPGDDALIRRIQELERRQNELLPAVMAAVGPAFTQLQEQLDTITAQQATLTDLVANEVAFAGGKASVIAVVPPTSYGAACSVSLTIPSWATHAAVMAIGSIAGTSSTPGGTVNAAVMIDGTSGDADSLNLVGSTSGHMTVLAQRNYSPGSSTIPVSVQWYRQNSIVGASAFLIVTAICSR